MISVFPQIKIPFLTTIWSIIMSSHRHGPDNSIPPSRTPSRWPIWDCLWDPGQARQPFMVSKGVVLMKEGPNPRFSVRALAWPTSRFSRSARELRSEHWPDSAYFNLFYYPFLDLTNNLLSPDLQSSTTVQTATSSPFWRAAGGLWLQWAPLDMAIWAPNHPGVSNQSELVI